MSLTAVTGDATRPDLRGEPGLIVHVCNDVGGWGQGFVLALSRRWPEPEAAYRDWHARPDTHPQPFVLGAAQVVDVAEGLAVVNVIAQHGVSAKDGVPPIRYDALATGLVHVRDIARRRSASVHMPRIGCGLAGGSWDVVGPLVDATIAQHGIRTVVYDLPAR